jgi:hypothetical protein
VDRRNGDRLDDHAAGYGQMRRFGLSQLRFRLGSGLLDAPPPATEQVEIVRA